ncbi:TMhelix containing protein [Vibrio phage 1.208.B._10N.222.52.A7]|nr:TMhelix containing protein [Vibrio phage 1.208.B._10N.222.52.A7]
MCVYVCAHAFYSSVGSDELMPFGSILMTKRYLYNTIMLVIFIGQGKKGGTHRGYVMYLTVLISSLAILA